MNSDASPLDEFADHVERGYGGTSADFLMLGDSTPFYLSGRKVLALLVEHSASADADFQPIHEFSTNPLHKAAYDGQEELISALIMSGARIDALASSGYTPLHVAALQGQIGAAERLIQLGANLEVKDKRLGATALHFASQCGHRAIVKALSNHGANLEALRNDGFTPLHIAASNGHAAIVEELIQRDADPNTTTETEDRSTALHIAAIRGHKEVARILIEKFSTNVLDVTDDGGATALHLAATAIQDSIVRLLLERGSDPNAETKHGYTPLLCAVAAGSATITRLLLGRTRILRPWELMILPAGAGHESILRILLNHGINVNSKDTEGQSPLHYATESGHFFCSKLLIERGANVQALSNDGLTPISVADRKGHQEVIDILARHGAKRYTPPVDTSVDQSAFLYLNDLKPYVFKHSTRIFILGEDNTLPLHDAAYHGQQAIVANLIREGANPMTKRSDDGATPLHLAAQNNHSIVVEFLLSHGAEANTKTIDGITALHYAAYNGHHVVLEHLLGHEADLEIPNEDGMTALHLAAQNGHESIVKLLIKSGAKSTCRDRVGAMPLHLAAEGGHTMSARHLIDAGATVNATTNEGITPLHLAAKNGNLATSRLLISHHAYVRALAKISSVTALELAARYGHKEVIILLINSNAAKDMSKRRQKPTQDPVLCSLCAKLDFATLFRNPPDSGFELGTVADAKARNCALCTMILQHPLSRTFFQKRRESNFEDSDTIKFEFNKWEAVLSVDFQRNFVGMRGWPRTTNLPLGSRQFHLQLSNEEYLGQTSRPAPGHASGYQRVLPRYDSRVISKWIDECLACQPAEVRSDETQLDWKSSIQRLIDVEDGCLVEVSGLKDTPKTRAFAALSYVWGDGQRTTLTRTTCHKFHEPGSLTTNDESISLTIRHAIILCKDLGIKFLWVDALCIQQDDEQSKIGQIRNMPYVYENALFTIVAAGGNDANAGLCGLSDSNQERQITVPVQDSTLILKALSLSSVIGLTYWSTRAWTYQEFVLSPRRIFFSNSTIYFSCEHGTFQEGVLRQHIYLEPRSDEHVLSGYQPDWQKQWFAYAELVSEYTRRNLTHQADALLAFTAPTKVLSKTHENTKFSWAIPQSYKDAGLLWKRCLGCKNCSNSANSLPKRGNITIPSSTDGQRKEAPSWSWISRQGHVEYPSWLLNGDPDVSIIPKVDWLETEGENESILHIEADTATFLVLERHFGDLKGRGAGDFIYGHSLRFNQDTGDPLAVYDLRTGRRCGVIYDDEQTEVPANYTLVKLSQTSLGEIRDTQWLETLYTPADIPHGPGRDLVSHVKIPKSKNNAGTKTKPRGENEDENKGKNKGDDFHQFFDYEAYDCDRKWPVYNVLMVRWKSKKVAERIGVGKVHVDAFDNAETFKCMNFYLS